MGLWSIPAIRTTLPSEWNGLESVEMIIAAIPSWLALREGESFISWLVVEARLLFASWKMYTTHVYHTSAETS